MGQRPGQRHPLGLTAGQGGHVGVELRPHPQAVEGRFGLPPRPGGRPDRARRQLRHLVEHADPGAAAKEDLALVGTVDAGRQAQQRGLAGAVDPHHPDPVAVGHGEGEVLEQRPVRPPDGDALEIDEDGHEATRVPAGRLPSAVGRLHFQEVGEAPGGLGPAGGHVLARHVGRLVALEGLAGHRHLVHLVGAVVDAGGPGVAVHATRGGGRSRTRGPRGSGWPGRSRCRARRRRST